MSKTQKDLQCPLFDGPIKLSDNVLPTYCDIIKNYLCLSWPRNDLLELNNGKDPAVKNLCEIFH